MRGKAAHNSACILRTRITPAYAGKSSFSPICILSIVGSPPPMRGKASSGAATWNGFRITPAYAGKRPNAMRRNCRQWDHPRLCGEKATALWAFSPLLGSPPPMRGKVGDSKTWKIGDKDHPRLCGEKVFQTSEKSTLAGSPPPMRGKVFWLLATLCQPGITPAYAGKSQNHRPTHLVQKDHPRLCGEKATGRRHAPRPPGSPPPMRGKVS